MTSSRARSPRLVTLAGGLIFLLCLACKCGDPGKSSGAAASTSAAPVGTTDAAPGDADIAARLLKKLHDAACSSPASPHRVWCLVDGYATAPAGELPGGEAALVGLTIGLSDDFPANQSLLNNVSLSALGIGRSSGSTKAWITTISPTAPSEQKDTGEAVAGAALLFKGKATSFSLAPTLFNYVRSLPGKAKYAVSKGKKGWVIESTAAAEVRRVGENWVAVELPAARPMKGIYVSIFTDKYASK